MEVVATGKAYGLNTCVVTIVGMVYSCEYALVLVSTVNGGSVAIDAGTTELALLE